MLELVEFLAKSLVDDPSQVRVKETQSGDVVVIELNVADGDMGRVIGKGGATVTAIRTILKNCNSRDGKRYFIQIGDEVRALRKEVQNASY